MIQIQQIPVLQDNYIYLIHETESGETAVVDPAESESVLSQLEHNQWSLKFILNTHHHSDHVGGNQALKATTRCEIAGAAHDAQRIPEIDRPLKHNDTLYLGDYAIQVIECFGHTLGHIAFYIPEAKALFCGDTLFSMGCGRLFEGSSDQMWHSLQQFMQLPESTLVYCAHEYSLANARFALSVEPNNPQLQKTYLKIQTLRKQQKATVPTTLKQECLTNPFLRVNSPEIRKILNMPNSSELAVFTELRHRKDSF